MFKFETHMDFVGQYRAEMVYRIIITLFGFGGICYGYHKQSFSQTVLILSAGFLLAALLTMPPWPFYRRHPLKWLKATKEPKPVAANSASAAASSSDEKPKKKKQ